MYLPIDNNQNSQSLTDSDRCKVAEAIEIKLTEIVRLRRLQVEKPNLFDHYEAKIQPLTLVVRALEKIKGRARASQIAGQAIRTAVLLSSERSGLDRTGPPAPPAA